MVPEPEMFAFWKSAFPAFSTSPSFRPLSSAVSRTRKWSYEAAPDFAPPYTGAIRLSLFNVLKASSKAACDDAQQLMPFSTPSHTPRSDDNMQMRLRLRCYFLRFYIAVFGNSASLCRLHSMPHHLAIFHRRPYISSIFDAILPQKNPARATAAASAAASSSSAPSSSSAASKRGKGYGRSSLGRRAAKGRTDSLRLRLSPPATCGLISGGQVLPLPPSVDGSGRFSVGVGFCTRLRHSLRSSASPLPPNPGVLRQLLASRSRDTHRRGSGSAAGGGHRGGLPFLSWLLFAPLSRAKTGGLASHHQPREAQQPLHHLPPSFFRVDTVRDVALLLQPGDRAASIDLRCVFPRPDRRIILPLPPLRSARLALAVLRPSLRSVPRPSHLGVVQGGVRSSRRGGAASYPARRTHGHLILVQGVRCIRRHGAASHPARRIHSELSQVISGSRSAIPLPRPMVVLDGGDGVHRRQEAALHRLSRHSSPLRRRLVLSSAVSPRSSPGALDGHCRCPSPCQCEGAHGPSHLPVGLPSLFRRRPQSPVEDGQHSGFGVCEERRWLDISPFPPHPGGASSRPPPSPSHPPRLHPDGGEPPRRCGVSLPVSPGSASSSSDFRCHLPCWGCPDIDLFATAASTHLPLFFAWGDAQEAEAFDALAQRWSFRLAYAFPPPLLPRVLRKLAVSTGVFLLVTPHWPTQKWFPVLLRLQVEEVFRLPLRPEVVDLTSGRPPLPRLPLLAWKLSGGSTASTSRTPPSPTSAEDGEGRRHDAGRAY